MKRVAVFCGSSNGSDAAYQIYTSQLGHALAARQITLVYGGAKVGLMGAIADAVLARGGEVIGVLPKFLRSKEISHKGLTELIMVESMHERKMKMHELSDGIIALPGGFGTLEELFEMLTWAQLGLHQKPIALFNMNGFYDPLLKLMEIMVEKKFLKEINYEMLLVSDSIDNLLEQMENYKAPAVGKWINEEEV